MRKLISLTRILIKCNLYSFEGNKKKKIASSILYLILFLAMIPLTLVLYYIFANSVEFFKEIHEEGFLLFIGFNTTSLIIFVFSIFIIPSVYFFSKDTESLLCLPLKPQTILGSKFIVTLIYELTTALIILLPLYVVYVQSIAPSPLYAIYAAFIFLTIPIFPLILSSILLLFLMGFVPFFKNRDRFNMIAGFLGLFLALGINVGINLLSRSFIGNEGAAFVQGLAQNDHSLLSIASYLLPNIQFAIKALIGQSAINLFIYILIVTLAIIVFFIIGKYAYFKGAIGFNETVSSRKEISHNAMNKLSRHRNIIATYTAKELKIMLRTPIFAINCLSSVLMGPILFIILTISGNINSSEITTMITLSILPNMHLLYPYALPVGIIIGIFLGSATVISSTAISREGSNVYFMKFIPVSIGKQIQAKLLSGILISWVSILVTFLCIYAYFHAIPLFFFLATLIPAMLSAVLINMFGIMIDIARPKLVWETEAAAIKRNLSGTTTVLSGWAICAILGFGLAFIPSPYILPISIAIFVSILVLILLINKYLNTYATKHFEHY